MTQPARPAAAARRCRAGRGSHEMPVGVGSCGRGCGRHRAPGSAPFRVRSVRRRRAVARSGACRRSTRPGHRHRIGRRAAPSLRQRSWTRRPPCPQRPGPVPRRASGGPEGVGSRASSQRGFLGSSDAPSLWAEAPWRADRRRRIDGSNRRAARRWPWSSQQACDNWHKPC